MRKQIITAAVIASCAGTTSAFAVDVGADTTVGGVAYFDFSYIKLQNENAAGTKIDTPPTGVGFDVKRFYLIVNHKFSDVWAANLTTDAQFSTASTATVCTAGGTPPTCNGTTTALTNQNTSGGVTEVMIKKLYLEGKFDPAFVIHVGAFDNPWAPWVESVYGYRYIEKTTTDRLGFANTADWGLNALGSIGEKDFFTYSASVLNGGGYKNPTRTDKVDFEGRVGLKFIDWLQLGAGFYSGHLGQVTATNKDFHTNTATRFDALAAVNLGGLKVGAEYFQAKNYKTVNNLATSAYGTSSIVGATATSIPVADKADGVSAFGSFTFSDQWSVFARYDNTKLSKDVAPNLKDQYANLGVAWKPIKPLDFAAVYKHEKVDNGSTSVSAGNANSSYTIGGANNLRSGTFDEFGVYVQYRF
jgi:hypothetical protein